MTIRKKEILDKIFNGTTYAALAANDMIEALDRMSVESFDKWVEDNVRFDSFVDVVFGEDTFKNEKAWHTVHFLAEYAEWKNMSVDPFEGADLGCSTRAADYKPEPVRPGDIRWLDHTARPTRVVVIKAWNEGESWLVCPLSPFQHPAFDEELQIFIDEKDVPDQVAQLWAIRTLFKANLERTVLAGRCPEMYLKGIWDGFLRGIGAKTGKGEAWTEACRGLPLTDSKDDPRLLYLREETDNMAELRLRELDILDGVGEKPRRRPVKNKRNHARKSRRR